MTTMLSPKIINGVNVDALFDTMEAIRADTAIARFNFRVTNTWLGGDRNRTRIAGFTGALAEHRVGAPPFEFENGEPEVLLGADKAPNPAEWVLHALIGCLTTSTAYHAAANGVTIDAIDSELDGDLDLRGFLGMSNEVSKGYAGVNVRMRVKTKASPKAIEGFAQFSPVLDMVSRAAPVRLAIETY